MSALVVPGSRPMNVYGKRFMGLEPGTFMGLEPGTTKAHERVREKVPGPVELRGEIIAFRLPLAAKQGRLLLILVHVMWYRSEIIEELAINRPALVSVPQVAADDVGPEDLDRLAQR